MTCKAVNVQRHMPMTGLPHSTRQAFQRAEDAHMGLILCLVWTPPYRMRQEAHVKTCDDR